MIQQMIALAMLARSTTPSWLEQELVSVGFKNISINPGTSGPFFFGYYDMLKQDS